MKVNKHAGIVSRLIHFGQSSTPTNDLSLQTVTSMLQMREVQSDNRGSGSRGGPPKDDTMCSKSLQVLLSCGI